MKADDGAFLYLHDDFLKAIKDKVIEDPWKEYVNHLAEFVESYKVVKTLIGSFLTGKTEEGFPPLVCPRAYPEKCSRNSTRLLHFFQKQPNISQHKFH